ncbi:MAG: lysine 2,3-aminomutase, partial [Alphaproteobacteria bacterium]
MAPETEPPHRGYAATLDARPRPPAPPLKPEKPAAPRFPIGTAAEAFRRQHFPDATKAEWNDWRWQLRSRIRTLDHLARVFRLSDDERTAVASIKGGLPVGITPYYASLMDLDDPADGLRRTHIPVGQELVKMPGEADDPLGEDHDSAAPGLVH